MNVVKSMSHLQSSKNFCFKTIKQYEAKNGAQGETHITTTPELRRMSIFNALLLKNKNSVGRQREA